MEHEIGELVAWAVLPALVAFVYDFFFVSGEDCAQEVESKVFVIFECVGDSVVVFFEPLLANFHCQICVHLCEISDML